MAIRCQISVSVDGYAAGPNPSHDEPLGEGGERLHEWAIATDSWQRQHGRTGGERNVDAEVIDEAQAGVGAYVMGRNMFGGGPGPWDASWRGWWGDEPPFHAPVFVVTHHARDPLPMEGGTTFTFVTDGVGSAIEQARAAAGDGDVMVAGGASTVNQALAAGLLDELYLHVVPVVLGGGERLFVDVGDPKLEPVDVVASPAVTHVRYRVLH
ncbi:MAG TPA: dihydrofolate reductase family protein [Capillimicrobium sp.]|nr:dihydrofolate reductase family protein [Capillimicrobium sp.]